MWGRGYRQIEWGTPFGFTYNVGIRGATVVAGKGATVVTLQTSNLRIFSNQNMLYS